MLKTVQIPQKIYTFTKLTSGHVKYWWIRMKLGIMYIWYAKPVFSSENFKEYQSLLFFLSTFIFVDIPYIQIQTDRYPFRIIISVQYTLNLLERPTTVEILGILSFKRILSNILSLEGLLPRYAKTAWREPC